MKKSLCITTLLIGVAITSCKKNNTPPPDPVIETDKTQITLYAVETAIDSFNISSNTSWTIAAEPASDWLKLSASSGKGNQKVLISYQDRKSNATASTLVITDESKKVVKKIAVTKIPFYTNPAFKLFGGTKDDNFSGGCATGNGGYILVGSTGSYDGDLVFRTGTQTAFHDGLIVKYNADGSVQWKRTYGGNGGDYLNAIAPAPGGGYFVSGYSSSTDGDFAAGHGSFDFWVMKIKENGDKEWNKVFGGSKLEYGYAITSGIDEGCLVVGTTYSKDGDVKNNYSSSGFNDGWVIKVSSTGILLWSRNYGSSGWENLNSVIATPEGGFMLAGSSWGRGNDIPEGGGGNDAWLLRIKNEGSIVFSRVYGGTSDEGFTHIIPDPAGGYLAAGYVASGEGPLKAKYGNGDALLFKCNNEGQIEWHQAFGGSMTDFFSHLTIVPDKGILIAGTSPSTDFDLLGNKGGNDGWLVLTNMKGEKIWSKTIGGKNEDRVGALFCTSEKKIITAGHTQSNDGDMKANHGLMDGWLLSFE
ncbi:BACON domain-containing protein [Pseudoflavitalea sp. G-6-1-2]|uniref:BACON domain-containing protein n=1 Tax=Pseudoflavitalea sp. G-6-1-2 TaxID=2728841 RepID=UPI00146D3B3F|nr:BACON domain-containing protein [Pseudoflavitalea sp. G-6-1-2]NML22914.1 BACON domain-containing protein [Pseudoflavitalea sp. G-6-1-2]